MKKIQAEFHITTPCFLGSAGENAELRIPSIKGALRFWWRALSYAQYDGNIRKWSKHEQYLFGSSDRGQSGFLMRLTESKLGNDIHRHGSYMDHGKDVGEGVRYLGYGLMKAFGPQAGALERSCLWNPKGLTFSLNFLARNTDVLDEIVPAIKILGLLGSVGSRSRKGFGSLTLTRLIGDGISPWHNPANRDEYNRAIRELLSTSGNWEEEPRISAFYCGSRIDCLLEGDNALDLLNKYGEAMIRYRSWGKNGYILNGKLHSEKRFSEDHDWFKREKTDAQFHPKRAVFGLPHNYFNPEDQERAEVKPQQHDRRASPLFFHVHRYGEGNHAGVALLMRSQFLPDNERIKARNKAVPAKPDWSVLTDFLDEKEYFANSITLWPA